MSLEEEEEDILPSLQGDGPVPGIVIVIAIVMVLVLVKVMAATAEDAIVLATTSALSSRDCLVGGWRPAAAAATTTTIATTTATAITTLNRALPRPSGKSSTNTSRPKRGAMNWPSKP
jgi:hypothetical protein